MPTAPRSGCNYPRCPNDGVYRGLCVRHAVEADRSRGTAAERGYDAAWQRLRARVAAEEPYCRLCLAAGRRTPTEHIDHIKPKAAGGTDDRDNLRGLCRTCHNRRTATESSHWGRR